MIAPELEVCLHNAFIEARRKRHKFVTAEHLLLAVLDAPSVGAALRKLHVPIEQLKDELEEYIAAHESFVDPNDELDTQPDRAFQRVLERAINGIQTGSQRTVTGAAIVRALLDEKGSAAQGFLAKRGLRPDDLGSWADVAGEMATEKGAAAGRRPPSTPMSAELESALQRAFQESRGKRQAEIDVEHLLLALLDAPSVIGVLLGCGANLEALRRALGEEIAKRGAAGEQDEIATQPTLAFQRVVQRAILHVQSSAQESVTGAEALIAIFGEKDSRALRILQEHSVTRLGVTRFLAHAAAMPAPPSDAAELQVVIYNDDFTTMEFVIDVLQKFFAMNREEAADAMMEIHQQGKAVCGLYSRQDAQGLVAEVTDYAERHGHPLLCRAVAPK